MKPASARFLLLLAALPLFSQTVHAECDPRKNCPYGPAIADRWDRGHKLEVRGNYAGAIKEYEQALAASRKLTRKSLDKKQVETLRACAVHGSQARLEAARAGHSVLVRDKSAKKTAAERAEQMFKLAGEEFDRKQPALAAACP